jgi:aspartokinase-like uncharacterized kinase
MRLATATYVDAAAILPLSANFAFKYQFCLQVPILPSSTNFAFKCQKTSEALKNLIVCILAQEGRAARLYGCQAVADLGFDVSPKASHWLAATGMAATGMACSALALQLAQSAMCVHKPPVGVVQEKAR